VKVFFGGRRQTFSPIDHYKRFVSLISCRNVMPKKLQQTVFRAFSSFFLSCDNKRNERKNEQNTNNHNKKKKQNNVDKTLFGSECVTINQNTNNNCHHHHHHHHHHLLIQSSHLPTRIIPSPPPLKQPKKVQAGQRQAYYSVL
jgi:hypothetical protein